VLQELRYSQAQKVKGGGSLVGVEAALFSCDLELGWSQPGDFYSGISSIIVFKI
jgi:hypothetical protein